MSPDDDRDYITINPAVKAGKYNVVIMRWDAREHDYVVFRMSEQLPETAARSLAQCWALASRLEVR